MDNEALLEDLKQFIDTRFAEQMNETVKVIDTRFAEHIEDTKQFIDAKFSQQDAALDEKLERKFKEELAPIKQKLDDLTDFVTEAIDTSNEVNGTQLKNHEMRITKLEQRVA